MRWIDFRQWLDTHSYTSVRIDRSKRNSTYEILCDDIVIGHAYYNKEDDSVRIDML